MKMIYAKRLHIHSCFASWSSNDVILYKETTKEFFDVGNTKKEFVLPTSKNSFVVSL